VWRQLLLFPSPFPTLLGVISLEGGYGQTEGIRERSMLFHDSDAVASVERICQWNGCLCVCGDVFFVW